MKKIRRQTDFVPEENEWMPDANPELWADEETEEGEDEERTLVLKPIQDRIAYEDDYEEYSGDRKYSDYDEDFDDEDYDDDYENESEGRPFGRSLREKFSGAVKPDPHRYGKDPYENLEEEPEDWPDEWEVQSGRPQPGTGRQVSQRRGRKRKTWWHRPILFRLVSLICMFILLAGLCKGFWAERDALGPLLSAAEEHNYAELFYLFLVVCTAVYGAFSMLWMLSRKRVYWDGRLRRMDVGRGITAFLLFAVLVFVSARMALRLPDDSSLFRGISQYMLTVSSAKGTVYVCSIAGIVSCILRKNMK